MATLNGSSLLRASLTIPPAGAWTGYATLAGGALPALGPATLTIGDLEAVGAVIRVGEQDTAEPRVVLAGGAGWRSRLPAPGGSYTSAAGVRLSTVLRDLARAARYNGGPTTGEVVELPDEKTIGQAYGWDAGTRGTVVLADLVRRGSILTWRVAPNGATRFDAWPDLGAADAFGVLPSGGRDIDRGRRTYQLSTHVAAFLPGSTVESVRVARVTIAETGSELTATVHDA